MPCYSAGPNQRFSIKGSLSKVLYQKFYIKGSLGPQIKLYRREAKLPSLRVIGEEERFALAPVNENSHHQHIAIHARGPDLVARYHAVVVALGVGSPVLLETIEWIGGQHFLVCLPVRVVHLFAIGF